MEVWGRGTNRVIAMCQRHGTAPPTFEERSGFLIVTFKAQMVAGGALDTRRPQKTSSGRLAEKVGRKLVEELAETQRKILDLMSGCPTISKRDLAAKIGISTTAIDKNIASLKAKGLVRRVGPDKGGRWETGE